MKSVKNFIGAVVCAIICTMSLEPVLAGQGGGLVGGGGDGLIDTTNFIPLADVVVPPPFNDNIGYLTVELPGDIKLDRVFLYRYQVDSEGNPIPFSMHYMPSQTIKLNTRTVARPGRYFISIYERSYGAAYGYFIEIKKHEDIKLKVMSKIVVQKSADLGFSNIGASLDFTNREMQERELLYRFLSSDKKDYESACNIGKIKAFCLALLAKRPEELENLIVRFTSSGYVEQLSSILDYAWSLDDMSNVYQSLLYDPANVFPGVYKIEWKYSLDGSKEYTYGVVVE